MALDYFDIQSMRRSNPAWRLMIADNAPLVAGFLDSAFREQNNRSVSESELIMRLEDYLFQLREIEGEDAFPRAAKSYLDEWAHTERGWLRKFYPPGSDEAYYDLTPATETALQWIEGLFETGFVGTESRLYTAVNLLREIATGVEEDTEVRIAELKSRRKEIDEQIRAIRAGEVPLLDSRSLRERFQQFSRTARELLADFRAVEHNFRELDRSVREQIAAWAGEKSEMLDRIFGEHDAITESEQGESFRAFWDFLMSPHSQEELTGLLDRVFEIDELGDALSDERLRRIHFDWMSAGEQTQRTVARLSQQLRSYLDDKAFYEDRRIINTLSGIERKALALRSNAPKDSDFIQIDDSRPAVTLPLDRPLFSPPLPVDLTTEIEHGDESDIDASALFDRIVVDRARLEGNIEQALRERSQITLRGIVDRFELKEGLTELLSYFSIAADDPRGYISEDGREVIAWTDPEGVDRRARSPRVVFARGGGSAGNGPAAGGGRRAGNGAGADGGPPAGNGAAGDTGPAADDSPANDGGPGTVRGTTP